MQSELRDVPPPGFCRGAAGRLQRQFLEENFDVSTLPEDAMREIKEEIKLRIRFNAVVETGIPGFIPRAR